MSGLKKIVGCIGFGLVAVAAVGDGVPAGTVADIVERTLPFGKLCLEGDDCGGIQAPAPAPTAAGRSGSEIYNLHCRVCHEAGLNDAPIIGNAEVWEERLAKGMDELLRTSKEGLNLMPPMGTCMSCTDGEMRAAIEYMTASSGEGD